MLGPSQSLVDSNVGMLGSVILHPFWAGDVQEGRRKEREGMMLLGGWCSPCVRQAL